MNTAFEDFLNTCTYYIETGLRHGYPLKELMWVILSSKAILSISTSRPHITIDVLKAQHSKMVKRYREKLKGNKDED